MNLRKAFTVVELLVVISIIAVLIALLSPALHRAREHSQFAVCQSNLHQYGIAGATYAAENNDCFTNPHKWFYLKSITGSCRWHDEKNNPINRPENTGSLWPYLNNMDVHLCPTFYILAVKCGHDHPYHYEHPDIPIDPQYCYSMNARLGRLKGDGVLKMSQAKNPSRVLWFAEENMWTIEGKSYTVLNDTALWMQFPAYKFGEYGAECVATYHFSPGNDVNSGRGNIVFVDGHVDSILAQEDAFKFAMPK